MKATSGSSSRPKKMNRAAIPLTDGERTRPPATAPAAVQKSHIPRARR
ncbi:MAG: hypothetical protein A4E73_00106 [Syntrophaceae bacterium PtaU1.Bin231]|nr:MAG: hypothetical protein A4E73_00106 [Syntrophaceae bacterium PtaU1.Bin231]